jgi:hypothetical protein
MDSEEAEAIERAEKALKTMNKSLSEGRRKK